jgi:hypothetical protein
MIEEKGYVKVEILHYLEDCQPGIVEFKLTDAFGRNWYFVDKVSYLSDFTPEHNSVYPQQGSLPCKIRHRFVDGIGRNLVQIVVSEVFHLAADEYVFDVLANKIEHPVDALNRLKEAHRWTALDEPRRLEFNFQHFRSRASIIAYAREENIADLIEESRSVNWGYFALPNSRLIIVGYNRTGLIPQAAIFDRHMYIGTGEFCVCYELRSGMRKFTFRMPFLFLDFVRFTPWLIVKNEIGFIGLNMMGEVSWSAILGDLIETYSLSGSRLEGRLLEGKAFDLKIPD